MDHPCKGLSKAKIDTFEQLAVGAKPPAARGTFDALEKHGVIVRGPDLVWHDAFVQFKIPQWEVPIHIHAQWCAWCGENVDDDQEGGSNGD